MPEITIPVEGVKLDGNTQYKLNGLEASTTYEVTLTSDKFVDLEITEDKDDKNAVRLQLEAIHDETKAIRTFTDEDNPDQLIVGDEAFAFFDYFKK